MKIAVAGTGYVGLSLAVLLAQKYDVVALDIIPDKVEKINNKISPIKDEYIEKYLMEECLNLTATLDAKVHILMQNLSLWLHLLIMIVSKIISIHLLLRLSLLKL